MPQDVRYELSKAPLSEQEEVKDAFVALSLDLFGVMELLCGIFHSEPSKAYPKDPGRWWRTAQGFAFDCLDEELKVVADSRPYVLWNLDDVPGALMAASKLNLELGLVLLLWEGYLEAAGDDVRNDYGQRGLSYSGRRAKGKIQRYGRELGVEAGVRAVFLHDVPIEDVMPTRSGLKGLLDDLDLALSVEQECRVLAARLAHSQSQV